MFERRFLVTSLLNSAWLLMFAVVIVYFSLASEAFLTAENGLNILVQASTTAILATGMTFVLLTAGVDLSIGSTMYMAGIAAGMLAARGLPLPLCIVTALLVGMVFGAVNGGCVAFLKLIAFVVTLATMHMGRGAGLLITETQGIGLPEAFQNFGSAAWLGIPAPIWIFVAVLTAAHLTLQRTTFGRYVYAVGHDAEAAAKAGIPVRRVLFWVYVICGVGAAVGALVAMTQTGSVASKFGQGREFNAIAAAVLGGTSLFGGRGGVFPGAVFGALLIQTVENGLVLINADPYLYPLITSSVIFGAVLVDSFRRQWLEKLNRRGIRPLEN